MSCYYWRQRTVATYGVQGLCDGIQARSAAEAEGKEAEEKEARPQKGAHSVS